MNIVPCSESCRYQTDGMCTLDDLTRLSCSPCCSCRYFEAPDSNGAATSSPMGNA